MISLKHWVQKYFLCWFRKEAVLQTALNGSKHILSCKLDDGRTCLESVQWIPTKEARQNNEAFIFQGQRARLMLGKVVDFMKDKDGSGIWKVAFEHSGLSISASTNAEVLPRGLEWVPVLPRWTCAASLHSSFQWLFELQIRSNYIM